MATEIRIEPRRSNQIRSVMEAKSEEWTNEFPRNREWRGGYEQQQQQKKSQQLIRSKKIKRKKEAHGIGLDKNGERRLDRYIIMLSSQQSPPLSLSLSHSPSLCQSQQLLQFFALFYLSLPSLQIRWSFAVWVWSKRLSWRGPLPPPPPLAPCIII